MSETSASETLVRAEGLTKLYPDGRVQALVDVNFELRAGEYVAIMGPSGSGKSTLLSLLGALDSPTSGSVSFEGRPLRRWGNLDVFRARKLGFVFQSFYLLPTLTALENVQIPMFEGDRSRQQRVSRAAELLDTVGLSARAHHLPSRLSIGERQRVAIARALANEPILLLADEPTGNLDSQNADEVMKLFGSLHRQHGMTVVVVTHSDEVAAHAQRLIRLRDGRVIEDRQQTRRAVN